jgi:fido (protein-threonine AMPylation protein)
VSHSEFERIHPFPDGNSRTGRLLLNLLLLRLGCAPAIIYLRDRRRYLSALRAADRGDPGPLGELLARSVLDNLYRFVVPAVAGPKRLEPLAALADKDLTEGALRVAANDNPMFLPELDKIAHGGNFRAARRLRR